MRVFFDKTEVFDEDFVYPTIIQEFVPNIHPDIENNILTIYYDATNDYILWLNYDGKDLLTYEAPFSLEPKEKDSGQTKEIENVIPLEIKGQKPPVNANKVDILSRVNAFSIAVYPFETEPMPPSRKGGLDILLPPLTDIKNGKVITFFTTRTPRDLYYNIKLIGQGTVGSVYLAQSVQNALLQIDPKNYAVKYVNISVSSLEKKAQELRKIQGALREIHILSIIPPHKNIITMIDSGYDKLGTFLVMPYLTNSVNLDTFLADTRQKLSLKQKVNIILQLTDAVRHLHNHNIVHLDIKEDNCLIDKDTLIPVLIDFNLSCVSLSLDKDKEEENKYTCSGAKGSPGYMDPVLLFLKKGESMTPQAYLKSDVYSLAVTAYQIVLGVHPFYRGDNFNEFRKVMQKFNLLPFVTGNSTLDILLRYMFSKNRPDIQEVYETLTIILQEL